MEEAKLSDDGACAVCGSPGRACTGCYTVYYCGKDHQQAHWKREHKGACSPFKMCAEPVCLGCCRRLEPDPAAWFCCSKCGWPLCEAKCQSSPHHFPECSAMTEVNFRIGRDSSPITVMDGLEQINQWAWYGAIMPIRALRLPPKDYKQMMNLQTHIEEHRRNPEFNFKLKSVTNFIRNTMKLSSMKDEDIAHVLAIFDTNAFEVCREDLNLMGRVLYFNASLMAHSCQPNARLCYIGDGFEMLLMAEQNIATGESICISYMDRLQGTLKRLSHLRTTKYFDCACSRCRDPTDLGLFMDSVRCTKCRDAGTHALLISTSPLHITADWKCQSCQQLISAAEMFRLHKSLRSATALLDNSSNLVDFEEFLKKQLGISGALHETSTYVLKVKAHIVFNILGHSAAYSLREMNDEQLNLKHTLCLDLMKVANKLQPGYSRTRGYLFLELHDTLLEKAQRKAKSKLISKDEIQSAIIEANIALHEAVSILREPARKTEVERKVKKFHKTCDMFGITLEELQ